MELRDKVVVVTGGASGIGTGLCRRFRQEGVRGLVIADLNADAAEDLAAELGGNSVALDVRDEEAIATMVAETEARFCPPWCGDVMPYLHLYLPRGQPTQRQRDRTSH